MKKPILIVCGSLLLMAGAYLANSELSLTEPLTILPASIGSMFMGLLCLAEVYVLYVVKKKRAK